MKKSTASRKFEPSAQTIYNFTNEEYALGYIIFNANRLSVKKLPFWAFNFNLKICEFQTH